ncbi:MAG: NUDIX hydrolase [Gaiellales bacterium]
MSDPRHVVAVCGFVTDGAGRVLLVRVADRGWEMPGGRVEEGEGLVAAVEREVLEETGCVVGVDGVVGLYSRTDMPPMVLTVFRCRHLGGAPAPADPAIADAGWFGLDEAHRLVVQPASAQRLRDAIANGQGLVAVTYRAAPYEVVSRISLP